MAELFLRGEAEMQTALAYVGRGRDKVIANASKSLAGAMRARYGHAPRGLLQRNVELKGEIEHHALPLALKNGTIYGGAFAVSFETGSPRMQQRDTDAIAFALEDVARAKKPVPLSVLVLPPRQRTPTYNRARHIFREIDAPIVVERGLERWAENLIGRLPDQIHEADAAA
jgi:hypothetical protein